MKYKTKLMHYKKQQTALVDYLQDPGEALTHPQKLKLCREVNRLQLQIDRLQGFNLRQINNEMFEYNLAITSALVRPRTDKTQELCHTISK